MKIGPHILSRGQLVPAKHSGKSKQQVFEAGDGSVVVSEANYVARHFQVKARLPYAEAMQLKAYIENGCRFSAEVITVVDGKGVSRQMRFWDNDCEVIERAAGLCEIDWPFREEVSA